MSSDRDMRKRVVNALRDLDAVSVENGCGVGTPDVNFVGGWIELKSMEGWPADEAMPLQVPHFTPQQRVWLTRRTRAGGRAWLLLKVAHDWLLFDGEVAARTIGFRTRRDLIERARMAWIGGLDEAELCHFLKE